MEKAFIASRLDGRSDRRVIVDLIAAHNPGDVLRHDELIAALAEDVPERKITRQTVSAAVRAANRLALTEHQRCLQAVPSVGYRVAAAEDHRVLAVDRRRRADNQIRMAVHTLQNVRWEEMSAVAREAHQATLTLMAGIWQAVESVSKRQDRMEALLSSIQKQKTV